MNISFYTGRTSMISQQDAMNIYSNNIANINTVGYKALRPSFADCVYTIQRETQLDWQTGHGQYVQKTDFMWEVSSFKDSDQPMDYALPNEGFFMVIDSNNQTFLTRDGSFGMTFNNDSQQWELANNMGEYVLSLDGEHIAIPFKSIVNEDGEEVITNEVDYNALKDAIGVFSVPNPYGLDQAEKNHFAVTLRSGDPVPEPTFDKISNYLEMSSVDLASEMVHLIETQRGYQLASKIISTSDEFMRIANNLRA